MRAILFILFAATAVQPARAQTTAGAADAESSTLTESLRPHPRLLFTPEREDYLRTTAETDTVLQAILDVVQAYAEIALDEPVVAYEFDEPNNPPSSRRLKAQRRASMLRVMNLSLTYRLTGDTRFAERAKADLLSAAQFPDWWPPHFLNVGEFAATVALGYDWIYDYLSEDERAIIREGIVKNGLRPGMAAYGGEGYGWWVTATSNWNQVCNGGLVLAALAVADDEPDLAEAILEQAVASVPRAMRSYLPDGAWEEGPTYWAYGTTYNGLILDALQTATDSLYGLDQAPGYAELGRSGLFHVQTVGPTNLYFNYGDAKRIAFFSPVLFWMSHHFDEPVYAWYERELVAKDLERMRSGALMQEDTLDRFLALLAVWYNDAGDQLSYEDLPFDTHFEGSSALGAMRSGWTQDALYLTFKGGEVQSNHGHMDLGTFVMDADGVRWALDLGSDDYGLPGYFDFSGRRWDYFRLNNHGHNTLVFGDDLQFVNAAAPMETFVSTPELAYGTVNLSAAYSNHTIQARRGFALLDRTRVLIQDEFVPLYAGYEVRWGMITDADISLSGSNATLTIADRRLRVDLLEPEGAEFIVLGTEPDDPREDQNDGTSMLAVVLPVEDRSPHGITVLLTPDNEENNGLPLPTFRPLNPTGTHTSGVVPSHAFVVDGAYPNPFRGSTTIRFDLASTSEVRLDVYDLTGRRVLRAPSSTYAPGSGLIMNVDARHLAAGVYMYRLTARSAGQSRSASGRFLVTN